MSIRVRKKPADAYQHGDLREALIQAGLKLLTDGGVAALGLRAAAQLAGVSHAAPYRHFPDKDALIDAIAERGFRMLTARMRDEIARAAAADTLARLTASGVGYVGFALENPGYFRVIFSGLVAHQKASPALRAAGDEAYGVLRGLMLEGLADGSAAGADADTLSLCAWSLVHGLSMLAVDGQLAPWGDSATLADQVTRRMLALLESGIVVSPARKPDPRQTKRRSSRASSG
jgi:AcrR family transcriptional regulator